MTYYTKCLVEIRLKRRYLTSWVGGSTRATLFPVYRVRAVYEEREIIEALFQYFACSLQFLSLQSISEHTNIRGSITLQDKTRSRKNVPMCLKKKQKNMVLTQYKMYKA